MAIIKAFKGIRPTKEKASLVAALPYDVVNSSEAKEMVKGNRYSFLHVDKAEIDLDENIYLYDKKVYEKASENLKKMINDNVLIQDDKPVFYIYRLKMNGQSQTGLVVCTSIDEYLNGTIKRHELTRADKEQDRINHVDYCNANTGPIFLAYRGINDISDILYEWAENNLAEYNFIAEDGIEHTVWVIDNDDIISNLIDNFKKIPNLYIADGHHRNASAVKVGQNRRAEKSNYTGDEEFNYYLSVLFDEKELRIFDYNRLVKDLNGLNESDFKSKLSQNFDLTELAEMSKPEKRHEFSMYLNGKWYCLKAKKEIICNDAVMELDVSILQNEVLKPLLGIEDARTDKRIDFVGGIRGLEELVRRVDSGEMAVAFALYPTAMEELMNIADENQIMPPKSTWFEPKLRSGLFIHTLED